MKEAAKKQPPKKKCIYCDQVKPESDFAVSSGGLRINRCSSCITSKRMLKSSRDFEHYLRNLYTKSKSARKDKFEWRIEVEHILDLWHEQEGKCALSGVYMTHHFDRGEKKDYNASIDRIRSNEGYFPDNIQLVAQRVNLIKNDLDEASLYWWVKSIHDNICD